MGASRKKNHANLNEIDDFSCKLPIKYILSSLKCNKIGECKFTLNSDVDERLAVEVVKDNGVSIINRMKLFDEFEPFDNVSVPNEKYSV